MALARIFEADYNVFQLLNALIGFERVLNQILEKASTKQVHRFTLAVVKDHKLFEIAFAQMLRFATVLKG